MIKVCGVVFGLIKKTHYFNPKDLELKKSDQVVIETDRGIELGRVITPAIFKEKKEVKGLLKDVIRLASSEDIEKFYKFKIQAQATFSRAQEKIKKYQLPMRLIHVEYLLDGLKIVFYFTAKGRIDFRELVKELAAMFKKRIEMYQIGIRDESKLCGSLGICGLVTCCKSFLHKFSSVSINMAKDQNLSLNPAKLSGVCGRLMCCLNYENDFYVEAKRLMPELNSQVIYDGNSATVVGYNVCKKTVIIEFPFSKARTEVKADLVKPA